MNRAGARRTPPGHVFLIGFSGSGKSTVGPRLARRLGIAFWDTDELIAQKHRKTIDRIFADEGEAAFRKYESAVIAGLLRNARSPGVIALGGGALLSRANRVLVQRHGIVVYLSCSIREIYRRMKAKADRPLLKTGPSAGPTRRQALLLRIRDLLNQRKPSYRLADMTVSTTTASVNDTVRRIYRRIRKQYADC